MLYVIVLTETNAGVKLCVDEKVLEYSPILAYFHIGPSDLNRNSTYYIKFGHDFQ
jgi:hypothetical protein